METFVILKHKGRSNKFALERSAVEQLQGSVKIEMLMNIYVALFYENGDHQIEKDSTAIS